jgi:hypothetical protein
MAARLLLLVVFMAVLSQFGGTLLRMFGVPNLIPLLRDGLLFALAALAVANTDVFKSREFFITILLCLLMIALNIGVAAFTDRHLAGLYYARLYLLPVVFAVAVRGLVMPASEGVVRSLSGMVLWIGVAINIVAFALFAAIEFNPNLIYTFLGVIKGDDLATVWYIAGGTWLRMGLPTTSPNALGMTLAFYLLLVVPLMLRGRRLLGVSRPVCVAAILIAVLALLMSFSRSSWLAVFVGGGLMFMLCRHEWNMGGPGAILKITGTMVTLSVLLLGVVLYVDSYSGGFILTWIELNLSGSDPSMKGHGDSFAIAIASLDEYFWLGYPKGTVGSRAYLFGGEMHNVENSFFALFFEMGVPMGMAYLALIASVLRGLWIHKSQWGVLAAFFTVAMFLPYVFEPEIVALFLLTYVLLGRAMQLAAEAEARGETLGAAAVPPKRRRATSTLAFQATVLDT